MSLRFPAIMEEGYFAWKENLVLPDAFRISGIERSLGTSNVEDVIHADESQRWDDIEHPALDYASKEIMSPKKSA